MSDYDFMLPSSPSSDRLVINTSANTPLDEADQASSAVKISVDGSYVTVTVPNDSPGQPETPTSVDSVKDSHDDMATFTPPSPTPNTSAVSSHLNQAFTEHTLRKSAATPLNVSLDYSNIQRRLWFDQPTTTRDVTSDDHHQSFVVDNIISMENDFDPRHSTPARTTVPRYNPSISAAMAPGAAKRPAELYEHWKNFEESSNYGTQQRPTCVQSPRLEKPPYTYVAMCVMAVHLNSEPALSVPQIRHALTHMFPFFRSSYKRWRRSVGNAVRSKYFKKNHDNPQIVKYEVAYDQITASMFRIQGRNDDTSYKTYLHEQLGVPAIPVKSLDLPPKPSFATESSFVPSTPDDVDIFRVREETVTPALSDTRSDDVIDAPPVKRQRICEPMSSVPVTKQTVMVEPTPQISVVSTTPLPSADTLLKPASCFKNTSYNQNFSTWSTNNVYGNNYYTNAPHYTPPSYLRDSFSQSAQTYNNMAGNTWMHSNTTGYTQGLPPMNSMWWRQHLGQFPAMAHASNPWSNYQGRYTGAFQEWCPSPLNLVKPENKICEQ